MAEEYRAPEIEKKWQRRWAEDRLYNVSMDSPLPKYYFLTMLPYTSGDLHIGHWYAMAPSDAKARYIRMQGHNVMFPMGFDAFGLPAENAAIRHGIHPLTWTLDNVARMRSQLKTMGAMFDWDREIVSCLPDYYRWTQWFFLQFYKHGLAYRARASVDFCPVCNTTLAREQVWGDDRHCERCATPVVKRELEQWLLRMTRYAEELLDFSGIEWPERVRAMQTNWIGRSEGVEFDLPVADSHLKIRVFTTRPDTVYGMTFAVLAPEHELVEILTATDRLPEVQRYRERALRQSEVERLSTERERDGVFIGTYAVNPMNGQQVPIYVADYVLTTYGTGAIMGVPAHDERDFDFARRYGLGIPVVIAPPDWDGKPLEQAYLEEGTMVNSGQFDGLPSSEAWHRIADYMEEQGIGERKVHYRLHDWLISRQRYWGAPIPIVYCERCGTVPVPEEDLPVLLPEDAEFLPTGESPLKYHEGFRYTTCPTCGGPAERETDTMDTFMCSSWYHMRYTSPGYDKGPFDPVEGNYWMPVDQYTGGIEHATMHLLYTRFFTKACRDMGILDHDEPMLRLFNQGIILGEDNEKMSKSRGNVVNPDDYVNTMGADSVRAYLMFIGPWEEGGPWSSRGIDGVFRFLNRVWALIVDPAPEQPQPVEDMGRAERDLQRIMHKTIRKVTDDMEGFHFNTMLAALMEYNNYLVKAKQTELAVRPIWREALQTLLLLLAPSCPHITEELWERMGMPYSIHLQPWPKWDEGLARDEVVTVVVQVNGRVRDKIEIEPDAPEEQVRELALATPGAQRHLDGKKIQKVIYAAGKVVNIVAR
ncbi:MAG: leucine--tRNA ligase [Anaerolineae bacterium]|nr:leucine--tRNA ligase [Anaerolineae bacterium]